MRYAPAPGAPFGVEVLSFARLREMDPEGLRGRTQRPDFHVLALVRSGVGRHTADFVEHRLRERSVVWIRPGVVHRWTDIECVDGPLILFRQDVVPTGAAAAAAADPFAPSTWQLDLPAWELSVRAARHLGDEQTTAGADPALASPPVLAHLLAALVLRVRPPRPAPGPADGGAQEVFLRYRSAVEAEFARRHRVTDYARALGHSPRTLTRATRAATGIGAKQFLDQRILLEAKRLLAHTDLPVARCAERLGFDDAANFTTFFQRQEGTSPSRWRAG
ncbi:AraC family transcriptional regulator [Streptomyces sp. NPDC052225]|uniref:AraC family transcriptional regulator n=1 Tax=Streptomyces sp. NPDC052225 TaxID=3154949 RepID=UPI003446EA1B